jgi:hypothetical protein
VPALCSALAWLGSAAGGIAMGQIAERVGMRWTLMFGALMIAAGLLLSSLGKPIDLYLGHVLFMGLLGNSGINYAAAFAAGNAFGLANTLVIAMLVLRPSRARAAARAGLIQPDSAVLAVSAGNYQRAASSSPQESWSFGESMEQRTAGNSEPPPLYTRCINKMAQVHVCPRPIHHPLLTEIASLME